MAAVTKKRKAPDHDDDDLAPGPAARENRPKAALGDADADAGISDASATSPTAGFDVSESDAASLQQQRIDSRYRALYVTDPDLRKLARHDAAFAAVLPNHGRLNFGDPAAVMQLTKTLLSLDFGRRMELPPDRLCPPVPNRHNYILWLKDLLDTSSREPPGRKLCGLDIGTGASCIYPLLGTAQRAWSFIATDIDAKNIEWARKNVRLNRLHDRVRVLQRSTTDSLVLLGDEAEGLPAIDFTMMNPPFYASEDEMVSCAEKKARPPHSSCTGAPVEMVCEGGELAHVERLVRESLVLRERVQWYTSMIGLASTVEALVDRLRKSGIDNYAVTELVQGRKTRRWALGWSFGPMRPAPHAARGLKAARWRRLLPPASEMELFATTGAGPAAGPVAAESLAKRLRAALEPLELSSWSWNEEELHGFGRAKGDVWSRAWRRKKQREREAEAEISVATTGMPPPREECVLGFSVSVRLRVSAQGAAETRASLRWVEGHDQRLFESLGGFLRRKIEGRG